MSNLTLRRLFVVILSLILGILAGWAIITIGFDSLRFVTPIETPQGRSIAEFGTQYFLWTAVPLGIIFMIWLDKFMDTHILPD